MGNIVTGKLFNTHEKRIEEVINKNIDIMLPGVDPIWENMVTTSMGVGPVDALGRDYKILKTYMGGITGIFEQGRPRGDFPLFGDSTSSIGDRLYQQSLTQNFPDPLDGVNAKAYRFGVGMRSMVANIAFTLGELQAEASPAFIGQIVAPKLEGFSRNIAQTLCNSWYTSQNDGYVLAHIADKDSVRTDATDGSKYLKVEVGNQAVDRFMVGMQLDIMDVSAGTGVGQGKTNTRLNESGGVRQTVVVDSLDELAGTITLVAPSGGFDFSTVADGASGTGDVLVHANSVHTDTAKYFTNIAGINSYLKFGDTSGSANRGESDTDANTILGLYESVAGERINVNDKPEHRSFEYDMNNALLTEHTMRQILRRFHAAKHKYGHVIDTLVASDGVWLGYESTKIGREILDRTGRLSNISVGQGSEGGGDQGTTEQFSSGFSFTMDGKTYRGYTSTYVENGVMYGLRMQGGNYKKYVPPSIQGTSTFDQAPAFAPFEFVAGALTGTGTNQLPIYTNANGRNLVTEASQMPGYMKMQIVPDQFSGLKIKNISEDRVYAAKTFS